MFAKKVFKRTRRPENANSGVCFGGGNAIYVGQQLGHVYHRYAIYLDHRTNTCGPYHPHYSIHLNYRLGDRLGKIAETIIMALATGFFGHGGTANKTSLSLTSLQAGDTPHRRYKVEKEQSSYIRPPRYTAQPNKDPLARAPPSSTRPLSYTALPSSTRPPSSTRLPSYTVPPSYNGTARQLKFKLQEPPSYIRPPSSTGPPSSTSA